MSRWIAALLFTMTVPFFAIGCSTREEAPDTASEPAVEEVVEEPVVAEEPAEEPVVAEEPAEEPASDSGGVEVIVGDVLDYSLEPHADWADTGQFGWVEFALHEGLADGEPIYFIRTDASDEDFADENGLVHVPLLTTATLIDGATSQLYMFEDQPAVMSSTPSDEDFSPAWHVMNVSGQGDATYSSAEEVVAAAEAGDVSIEETNIVVNYPVVKWGESQLPVDDSLDSYLGTGQLISLDTDGMSVTFKLHECYSGARYIVTDSSAGAMATDMMHINASPGTAKLVESGSVDNIWVYGNGIEGSGVMGFQPAVFRSKAGTAGWSPFWNHFTLVWAESVEPRVLTTGEEVAEAIAAGDVTEFNGTPKTDPQGFVVNCPVPILAPNSFDGG